MVDFEDFWKSYPPRGRTPRRTKKQLARTAWARLSLADRYAAAEGLEVAKLTRDWEEPRYIPEVHRWLRQRRWEDEAPDEELPFSPKEREVLRGWRKRVGSVCPSSHDPTCETLDECDNKVLAAWRRKGVV